MAIDKDLLKAIPKAVDKSTAKRVGEWALNQERTASGAARAINQSGYNAKVRGHHQDSFDPNHPMYKNTDDWAGQAQDGKWLIVKRHPEEEHKALEVTKPK